MGEESEQLRREIDETRRELGTDVDALTEKVSPSRVVGRRVDKARDAIGGLKEKVMGTTSDATSSAADGIFSAASTVGDKAGSAAGSVQGAASSSASTVADTASSTAQAARRGAEGNPLAAGVIAFGLGWLLSSLLPASQKEREVASTIKDQAQPALQPVAQKAGEALSEVKDSLRKPTQEAVQSVKETATDAADSGQAEGAVLRHRRQGPGEGVGSAGPAAVTAGRLSRRHRAVPHACHRALRDGSTDPPSPVIRGRSAPGGRLVSVSAGLPYRRSPVGIRRAR